MVRGKVGDMGNFVRTTIGIVLIKIGGIEAWWEARLEASGIFFSIQRQCINRNTES